MKHLWEFARFAWLFCAWPLLTIVLMLSLQRSSGRLEASEYSKKSCQESLAEFRRQANIERTRRFCEAKAGYFAGNEREVFIERCMEEAAKEEWR